MCSSRSRLFCGHVLWQSNCVKSIATKGCMQHKNLTSLVLLWTSLSSGLGDAFPPTFSPLSLATGCLSEAADCPSLATGCLSLATGCLTSCTLLAPPAFRSSDELAAVDAARTSAAIDMGGGEGFFCSFLKNRLPDEMVFSSLSLSFFKVKRPSLLEAWNYWKYCL